jgi:putative endonuclease
MFKVYAIESLKDGRICVGYSEDLIKRLKEHNASQCRSTKGYRPWELVYEEEVPTLQEALKLEKYYKTGSGKEKLKNKIKLAL